MITLIERKEKASPILDKPRHVETIELGKKDRGQKTYGDRLRFTIKKWVRYSWG